MRKLPLVYRVVPTHSKLSLFSLVQKNDIIITKVEATLFFEMQLIEKDVSYVI